MMARASNLARSNVEIVLGIIVAIGVMQPTKVSAGGCDAVAVGKLRARLELEHDHAQTWRYAWAIAFGAAAIGQGTVAALLDDRVQRDTLWTGAIKAAIGASARLVMPIRVDVPAADPDPCTDAIHLRDALADARRAERNGFWLNHIGGFLVNLGGAIALAHYTSWKAGALSFALGYPVGLTSTYTAPRWAWHAEPVDGGAIVGIAGAF